MSDPFPRAPARIIPPAAPANVPMQLRDLRLALRGRMAIARKDGEGAWALKGPGRCLSLREVVNDLLVFLEAHERRLHEVTTKLEESSGGVILERNGK